VAPIRNDIMSKVLLIKKGFFEKIEPIMKRRLKDIKGKKVAVKVHMGEYGNIYHIRPAVLGRVVEIIKDMGGKPFVFDTLAKYRGSRDTVKKYQETARKNGFTQESIGCPIMILDKMKTFRSKNFELEMPEYAMDSDVLVVVSHGKGHAHCAGFGGAIKNIGMGMISPKSKGEMHRAGGPKLVGKCSICKACEEECLFGHMTVKKEAVISDSCIGCGRCIKACPNNALAYLKASLGTLLTEPLQVVSKQIGDIFYVTALVNITSRCDCAADSGPPQMKDIGFLVSEDPVAIDKAAIDLIKKEKPDFFEEMGLEPMDQIKAAEKYKLGSSKYELEEI